MTLWDRALGWLRKLFGRGPSITLPGEGGPQPASPRVLVIVFDPVIHSEGGKKLTEVLGWNDVDRLTRDCIADLGECSGGLAQFQIVERLDLDAWPVKADGFCYDEAGYLECWRSRKGWHRPDLVDYAAIIDQFDLPARVESGDIDEVWLFGFPYAGFHESIMVGPDAFWCNAPPLIHHDGLSRRFVIMGFNYERGVGEMLESLGHRVESLLKQTWAQFHGQENLWWQFVRYDRDAPGEANCGSVHYAPNSETDYDWGNPRSVLSNCDDWLSFPDLPGSLRPVDCHEWGGGDIRAHHKWWLSHLPHAPGQTRGVANNWWRYAVDANNVPAGGASLPPAAAGD